jgi:hypothetical protein
MVQFGHEKTPQSPIPRALSWKYPAEHRIFIEGAGEHLSGLRRITTPGHPYLKTSHANHPPKSVKLFPRQRDPHSSPAREPGR